MSSRLRSLNPLLRNVQFWPNKKTSLKSFVNPVACQTIIDKLDLQNKYPNSSKSLDIVDIFPGFGLLSTMINSELKPRKHILMENNATCGPQYESLIDILGPSSGFVHSNKNGFKWESFTEMINDEKLIQPIKKSDEIIHDELLIVANLASNLFGEALFAQWIMCCAHQNWLQKYGRVRMVCTIPEATAQKFISGPGFIKRNRTSIKRDVFTDTKLVAIMEVEGDNYMPDGCHYDPNVLVKDQPVVIPLDTISPVPTRVAVVEVEPKPKVNINIDSLDYITQILMYRAIHPLSQAIKFISPGAEEDLSPKLAHLLDICPRDLTADQYLEIVKVFDSWAFKPTLEERLSLNPLTGED